VYIYKNKAFTANNVLYINQTKSANILRKRDISLKYVCIGVE